VNSSLLDVNSSKNVFIFIFYIFQVFSYDFITSMTSGHNAASDTVIDDVKISSYIEYLIPADNSLILLRSNLRATSSLSNEFRYDLMKIRKWLTFSGPPCVWFFDVIGHFASKISGICGMRVIVKHFRIFVTYCCTDAIFAVYRAVLYML